ncbi:DUF6048 family protein [Flavobacterium agrisoli]|uniref:Outer membrane protein with beta-barrel domain n=1 Tax=Flavobacterium agrisoli TaxID=2793066 RepID=A0A934PL73_9FLAO|nr:DUF6048 family protein [Flavobacterium agrisoli]MBK0368869.1 hypothetical protein [Flavobacterium agrisoli]
MKHILKYFFSFWLLSCSFGIRAQVKDTLTIQTDSFPVTAVTPEAVPELVQDTIKTHRYGLRVGVDLFKLTRAFWDHNYKGIELVGDYRLSKRYFLAAELGSENKTTEDDRLTSNSKGQYIKAGFDYNTYENWLDMENIISIGLRYGFSTFSQELIDYKIYNSHPYWGEMPPKASGQSYSGLNASWIEVNMGLKAKVFNNIFVGFSVQLKGLVTNNTPGEFDNLYIPGFNRTYDGRFGVGFNYTVSYFIPIYKKKIKIETE